MRLSTIMTAVAVIFPCVSAHGRLKYPTPLNAVSDDVASNIPYNSPLKPDGSDFPCKGLHKTADLTKGTEWKAGQDTYFEILGNGPGGSDTNIGTLAAHSGGSCQASISFDNGKTFKLLQSFMGGCPRGVKLNSNYASNPDQKFHFKIPEDAKAGPALFSWTWIAVTGNRDEFYQNCAAVTITGSGTSTLQDAPDMFLGDMSIGQIKAGECRSTAGSNVEYPNPGPNPIKDTTSGIPFKAPTAGQCFAPGSTSGSPPAPGAPSAPTPPGGAAPSTTVPSPERPPTKTASIRPTISLDVTGDQCKCQCKV
ncbi:hypothetical protein FPQ18DRAFT_275336 [Pyronema domesticum]|uniref:Lytic polysaccharide monooxygenase n=1 Tax=Pyronema omphalodes (strain CBS 100304) TaxID=1076935 RepID=U4LR33_PYROM|nr:hypothetical protein FPQ18DRAFT_275336 [Pyronema domesticum]CCX34395.1 Similar to hypothetical protein AOL_s00210g374 [Arthrobotrys oligospora ATCC 24927]; acc. no. EGX43927 [Pyronema omphalodes CBS 100304]